MSENQKEWNTGNKSSGSVSGKIHLKEWRERKTLKGKHTRTHCWKQHFKTNLKISIDSCLRKAQTFETCAFRLWFQCDWACACVSQWEQEREREGEWELKYISCIHTHQAPSTKHSIFFFYYRNSYLDFILFVCVRVFLKIFFYFEFCSSLSFESRLAGYCCCCKSTTSSTSSRRWSCSSRAMNCFQFEPQQHWNCEACDLFIS